MSIHVHIHNYSCNCIFIYVCIVLVLDSFHCHRHMWIDNSGHHIVTLLEPLFINAESFQHCNNFQLFSDYTIHEFSLWVGLEPPSYSYKPCLLKLWTNLSSQEAAPCIMFSWRVCLFPRSKSPLSTWKLLIARQKLRMQQWSADKKQISAVADGWGCMKPTKD